MIQNNLKKKFVNAFFIISGENLAMQREIDKTSKLEASSTATNSRHNVVKFPGWSAVILGSMLLLNSL